MIVYLARDIVAFVMYCIYGESGSSLLIESTDSMIFRNLTHYSAAMNLVLHWACVHDLHKNLIHK